MGLERCRKRLLRCRYGRIMASGGKRRRGHVAGAPALV